MYTQKQARQKENRNEMKMEHFQKIIRMECCPIMTYMVIIILII